MSDTLFDHMLAQAPTIDGAGVWLKAGSNPFDPFAEGGGYEAELIIKTESGEFWCVSIEEGEIWEIEKLENRSPEDMARYDAVEFRKLDLKAFKAAWMSHDDR